MRMFSAAPSYQMTQFIFMARTHEHIHINAVIWSIEQEHQLQRKPHDVCSQRFTTFHECHYSRTLNQPACLPTRSIRSPRSVHLYSLAMSRLFPFATAPNQRKLLCSRHMIFHTFSSLTT